MSKGLINRCEGCGRDVATVALVEGYGFACPACATDIHRARLREINATFTREDIERQTTQGVYGLNPTDDGEDAEGER